MSSGELWYLFVLALVEYVFVCLVFMVCIFGLILNMFDSFPSLLFIFAYFKLSVSFLSARYYGQVGASRLG